MKYLILIYSNPESRRIWESFSDAERAEGYRFYGGLKDDLVAAGELIAAEALADPSHARRIKVSDGRTLTTDGPFAEVKEHLAGFFLIDCDNLDVAVKRAARFPEAELGLVEVRPIMDLSGIEM